MHHCREKFRLEEKIKKDAKDSGRTVSCLPFKEVMYLLSINGMLLLKELVVFNNNYNV